MKLRKHTGFLGCKLFLLFVLAFTLPNQTFSQDKLPKLIKKIQPTIVSIITYDKKGHELALGSGFFINDEGSIITNCHVLDGAYSADVKTNQGEVLQIESVQAYNLNADIVMAKVDIKNIKHKYLKLSTKVPDIGSKVFVIGSPHGFDNTVSDGIVSSVREFGDYGSVIQITAPISPGSSGSPVINMDGEVIGVATFQYIEGQNLNFSIPGEIIQKLSPDRSMTLAKWQETKDDDPETIVETLVYDGMKYLMSEDYPKAYECFRQIDVIMPDVAEVKYIMGFCQQYQYNYSDAIDFYNDCIKLDPEYSEAYYQLGEVYFSMQKYKKTVEQCDKAIEINSTYSEAYNLRASAKEKSGDIDGAKSDYKLATKYRVDEDDTEFITEKTGGDSKSSIIDKSKKQRKGVFSDYVSGNTIKFYPVNLGERITNYVNKVTDEYSYPTVVSYEGEYKNELYDGFGTITYSTGEVYKGDFKEGNFNGQGTLTFSNGESYTGGFLDGKCHGYGTYIFPSGEKYEGEYKDNLRSGKGKYTFPSGETYTGEYLDGHRNGEGNLIFPSGEKYTGGFKNDLYDGKGTYTFANGDEYVGDFVNGLFHGQGTYTYITGEKYSGSYENDERNGFGTYTFPSGENYVGDFKDGMYNGYGTYTYANGEKYVGRYQNDKKHGHGIYTFPTGETYDGEFKYGKYSGQGTYIYPSGEKYVGQFKDNKRNGKGTYTYPTGEKYEGEFKNDVKEGFGTLTFPSGEKYVGEFKNGTYNGHGTYTYSSGEKYTGEFKNGEIYAE